MSNKLIVEVDRLERCVEALDLISWLLVGLESTAEDMESWYADSQHQAVRLSSVARTINLAHDRIGKFLRRLEDGGKA